jgi:hypothetical protein
MAGGLSRALLTLIMGKKGHQELQRVSNARQTRQRDVRDQNIEKMRAASEVALENMSPTRQQLVEMAMKVQRYTEERVFEGVSPERREALREKALDQVFGEGGGLGGK